MGETIDSSVAGPVILAAADSPLTITTAGTVIATAAGGVGVDATGVSAVTISNAGLVSAPAGTGVSLTPAGVIENSGRITGGEGMRLSSGSVANGIGGSITASGRIGAGFATGAGIYITGAGGTVTNQGNINAGAYGVAFGSGGRFTNAGVTVGGEDGATIQGGIGSVTNTGTIAGTVNDGVALFAGGAVDNNTGGLISATGTDGGAVFITGAPGSVTNSGTISSGDDIGVLLTNGGAISNATAGSITGSNAAVTFTRVSGTLDNSGSIAATGAAGADFQAGGNISNTAGAAISGSGYGIFITGGAGSLSNDGQISGTGNSGVLLDAGGSISNGANGRIASGQGVGVGVNGAAGTLTNAGTVSGGADAVFFGNSGDNRVIVDPGAVFTGNVVASITSTENALELAGGVGTVGDASGGNGDISEGGHAFAYVNFSTLAVDSGGDWTLAGGNTIPTVVDDGTIVVAGSLEISAAIDPSSTGLLQLDPGATLDIAAAAGNSLNIAFHGSSDLTIDNFGSFGTGVRSTSYAGPQLENFAAGDSIDLRQFDASGARTTYDRADGVLQVMNAAGQEASLSFEPSGLGAGSFVAAADGAGGVLLTRASVPGGTGTGGDNGNIPCFVSGTRIRDEAGRWRLVETLRPGDRLRTPGRCPGIVIWVGHRTMQQATPVLIQSFAFGLAPVRPLWLSPDHAVYIHGVLIPIHKLVNGVSILRMPCARSVGYVHVELEQHGIILAEDLACESFLDTGNRGQFDAECGVWPMHDRQRQGIDGLTATLHAYQQRGVAPLVLDGPTLAAAQGALRITAMASSTLRPGTESVVI